MLNGKIKNMVKMMKAISSGNYKKKVRQDRSYSLIDVSFVGEVQPGELNREPDEGYDKR
jgi:hypothetical protein